MALLPVKKLPNEWLGKRGIVVRPPPERSEESKLCRWTWVAIDGVPEPRYFYKSELRPLSLPELVGEL